MEVGELLYAGSGIVVFLYYLFIDLITVDNPERLVCNNYTRMRGRGEEGGEEGEGERRV